MEANMNRRFVLKDAGVLLITVFMVLSTVVVTGNNLHVSGSTASSDPPTVEITNPKDGEDVLGTCLIDAIASDDDGVSRVAFLVDDFPLGEDDSEPYTAIWDTGYSGNGWHTITAIAYDDEGNEGEDSITVCVGGDCDCLKFMGLQVYSLGQAKLAIFSNDMFVRNLGGSGEDGVLIIPEHAKAGMRFALDYWSISLAFWYEATIKEVYSFSNGDVVTIESTGHGLNSYRTSISNLGDAEIVAYNSGKIVFQGKLESDGDCGSFNSEGSGKYYGTSISNLGDAGIVVVGWSWNKGIITWQYNNENYKIDCLQIQGQKPDAGDITNCSLYGTFPHTEPHKMGELEFVSAEACDPLAEPSISGHSSGKTSKPYTLTISNTGTDNVYFYIDWGDESALNYTGLTAPGATATATHTYSKDGTYTIQARAMNTWSVMSDWTTLSVSMPKTKAKTIDAYFFLRFLEKYPILYQLLTAITLSLKT